MPVQTFGQSSNEQSRLWTEIGRLHQEDRKLRDRISAVTGLASATPFSAYSLSGTISAGDALSGGGTLPGTVEIDLNLHSSWSGLEIATDQLRVDLTAAFTWTGAHAFTQNITMSDTRWIGLGAALARIAFYNSGNSIDLYSSADLRLFSDAGSTQVAEWDGATGDIYVRDMYHYGDLDTYLDFSDDRIDLRAGGILFASFIEAASDEIRFNDNGVDVDFTVEASGVADALVVQGSDGQITLGAYGAGYLYSNAGGVIAAQDGAANPTANVGLSAVNGSATTWMRSDAAPALSQAITPTWSGLHVFSNGVRLTGGAVSLYSGYDLIGYSDSGSTETLRLDTSAGYIYAARFFYSGDTDTYVSFGLDQISLYAGGLEIMQLTEAATDEVTIKANLTLNDGTNDKVWLRQSGDVYATEADILGDTNFGMAANDNVVVFLNADDATHVDTGYYFGIFEDDEQMTGGNARSLFRINDSTIMTLRKSVIAHGMTSYADTDAFGQFKRNLDSYGGLKVEGFLMSGATSSVALQTRGYTATAMNTTHTTAARAVIEEVGVLTSTGVITNATADGNVWGVRTYKSGSMQAIAIIDEDGDLFLSGSNAGSLDVFEDAELVRAFDLYVNPDSVIRTEWDNFVRYNEQGLVDAGIIGASMADGGLVNFSQLVRLHNGAIWQQEMKIRELERRVVLYERAFELAGIDVERMLIEWQSQSQ